MTTERTSKQQVLSGKREKESNESDGYDRMVLKKSKVLKVHHPIEHQKMISHHHLDRAKIMIFQRVLKKTSSYHDQAPTSLPSKIDDNVVKENVFNDNHNTSNYQEPAITTANTNDKNNVNVHHYCHSSKSLPPQPSYSIAFKSTHDTIQQHKQEEYISEFLGCMKRLVWVNCWAVVGGFSNMQASSPATNINNKNI